MKLLCFLEEVERRIVNVVRTMLAVVLYVMMFVVFFDVVMRYVFNNPIVWGEEAALLMMVFTALFGAYVAMTEHSLARITALVDIVPDGIRAFFNILAEAATIFLLYVMTYYGTTFIMTPYMQMQKTPTLRLPMWIFYGFVPLACGLMLFHTLLELARYLKTGYLPTDSKTHKNNKLQEGDEL